MASLNVNYKILRVKSLGDSNVTESHLANLGFVKDAVVGKYYIVKKNQWFWSFEKKDNGHGNYKKIRNLHKEGGATWRPRVN